MNNFKKNYWESTNGEIPSDSRMILNEYLLSLKLENKAIPTIIKYCYILERFLNECRIPLSEIQSEDVRKWINEFSKGKTPKTIILVLARSLHPHRMRHTFANRTAIQRGRSFIYRGRIGTF